MSGRGEVDPETRAAFETLRAALRARRIDMGLTQTELADIMGRSQDYVSYLENEMRSIPNLATFFNWVFSMRGTIRVEFDE